MSEKIFPNGMMFKDRRENAPEWVKGSISIKVSEFVTFLEDNQDNGWVNIDLLESKAGKKYFALNQFKPNESKNPRW
jgi:hypothetical protein